MKVHVIEQRSDAWYSLRLGMPTASAFAKLVTSRGEPSKSAPTYAITLAAEVFAGKPVDAWQGNEWTERGRDLEDEALRLYEFTSDTAVERVGFVTDDDQAVGCSPDGLVAVDGLVEVKCLKAENHIKAILYYQRYGRCPTDYVQQTQGQMMVCERAWCDLVFYHPDLPQLIVRQEADKALFAAIWAGIEKVCDERDTVLAALRRQSNPTEEAA